MRIGLLVMSIGNFGQKGFYNAQEIGLAKALSTLCDEVKVYKLVPADQPFGVEGLEGCGNAAVTFLPSKHIGINGFVDTAVLDGTLDALICFADTQLCVPRVFHWARKNRVAFYPYIGVLESHSTSRLKRIVIDRLFARNVAAYQKCHCFVKTPDVGEKLVRLGANLVTVTPVGLDEELLKRDHVGVTPEVLKEKYGYAPEDKILLFVGRLTEEKQPVQMVRLFSALARKDDSYRLLMVGSGELRSDVVDAVSKHGLQSKARLLERIPNCDIWELYRMAEAFVNLNRQEIFGMAILEAMYYGCKVVAWEAPGPNYIIESGVSGWLVGSSEQVIERILDPEDLSAAAHNRIVSSFLWRSTAERMLASMLERI